MFAKLPRVSNLIPESASDVMSLAQVDRSLFTDKLSYDVASFLESLGQRPFFSSYEVATSPEERKFSSSSSDHRRNPTKKGRCCRNNQHLTSEKTNSTTKSQTTQGKLSFGSPGPGKARTYSANRDTYQNGQNQRKSTQNHRPNTKNAMSQLNLNDSNHRRSMTGHFKHFKSDEGITTKDSQKQMKQKAKMAIAMWKERMSKTRVTTSSKSPSVVNMSNVTEEMTRDEMERSKRQNCRNKKSKLDAVRPVKSLPMDNVVIDSPIPRTSPDDSSSDGSTKVASSSQTSSVCADNKINSASSRENQRSKIPRPVDGQGDKVKKNESVETNSTLSKSAKIMTSRKVLVPENLLLPRITGKNRDNPEKKRKRREDRRVLQSTDDDDDWPISLSAIGSQPIIPKPRVRHHDRRTPKAVVSVSPIASQAEKRRSGGDAERIDRDRKSPMNFSLGAGLDEFSLAVMTPQRRPYLNQQMVGMKLEKMTNEMIGKRQRQEIYALNKMMTALELAQFENFCRRRNFVLGMC
uniref:Uncharacterized protein n=1 Tax=Strigamia maritima TaxID=126957 RepID=T1J387_STRMM